MERLQANARRWRDGLKALGSDTFASKTPIVRVLSMVAQRDREGFGNCSNYYECEAVRPAEIPATVTARLNREYAAAGAKEKSGAE